ncbi:MULTISPECIES: lytic transglycosylase domain-containing protein [Brucella]|jgi:soluble lytic murein transglycosylase-like protein|uniref:Lytic transglycosylase domain-containing protein n=2 Tax=Brucella TaxID=234 RepID=A0A256GTC2_9HYPH|nr:MULTISPECIES: lytic transglycosylase domain-containing protein [Brucella]KAB2704483.1 lytic transglycosylase domain-containing protein [Brucella lupini]KAB2763199.1 lytic transglycosylase domain-containing protein [Brucella anthropi]OYR30389.1 transglycosylase SLT domain protein [Brucella lupini]
MPLPCIGHRQTRAFGRHHAARRIAFLLLSGLFLATTSAAAARAQNAPSVLQTTGGPIAAHVTEAAERFSIPEHWIRAIMQTESAGDRSAISSAGAMGLMQVMPDTWTELRLRYGFGSDPFAQRDNILAGTAYLREMLDRYSNIGAMLAAYNAGPARYDEYVSTGRALPAETRAYVAALVPLLGGEPLPHNLANASPSVTDWRDAGLFAVSASSPETAPGLHGERYASGTLAAPTSHHNPLVPAQPDALFPVRTSQGARP